MLRVYFDTSAWNRLADRPNRHGLIAALQARRAVVLASVYSAAEILRTSLPERRADLAAVMQAFDPDLPLLERPFTIAVATAQAFLRGEDDALQPQSGPGRTLLSYLTCPDETDQDPLEAWLLNSEVNLERFRVEAASPDPDSTRYHASEILETDAFLRLLLRLPPAVELGLSLGQVRDLYQRVDVWRAMAGTLGYILTQVRSHSPEWRGNYRRPGAADLWQAVYLGVVEIFVTSDVRQLEAVGEISAVLRYPRCVVDTADFLDGVEAGGLDPASFCRRCGSALRAPSPDRPSSFHTTT